MKFLFKTVAENWKGFSKAVLSSDELDEEQRNMLKKVFYSGFLAALTTLKNDPEIVSAEDAEKAVEELFKECEEFVASHKKRKTN